MVHVPLLTNKAEIDAYRLGSLSPEALSQGLWRGEPNLLNCFAGLGKTHAIKQYINTTALNDFDRVAYIAGRRDLLDDVAKGIDPHLDPIVYPNLLTDSICLGEYDKSLSRFIAHGWTNLADCMICKGCINYDDCSFAQRRDAKRFAGRKVVLLTDQLLKFKPTVLTDWGFGDKSLIVFDEANGANDGFVHTFTKANLRVEIEICQSIGDAVGDLLSVLAAIAADPEASVAVENIDVARKAYGKNVVSIQHEGSHSFGFKHVSPIALAYAGAPLWYEHGVYAVERLPNLPGTLLFMGAYLSAEFISDRYRLDGAHHAR